MSYSLEFRPAALRELRKLPRDVSDQLFRVFEKLAENPRPPGCLKMKGGSGFWRVRWGSYRVIYDIQDSKLVVLIVDVGHRKDIYN
ncbi:MAG: type II toxin-antitoxin system RelE/ParE family toxin [Verrucomicrobia bacterium]|nr:type II toxin-antitoxin system RelE/ParE family toxin [Verrucomicrobiota bacterium]